MNITFFGTYDTRTTPRVRVLIDGLRARGVSVTECNVPLPVSTSQRVAILRQPWRLPLFAASILSCWVRLIGKARRLPPADAVIIGHLGQFDIHLAHLLFRGKPLILDYMISGSDTGRDRQISSGFKHRLLVRVDNAALGAATTVVVDTEEHRQALPEKYRSKGVVVHVGAPRAWFDAARQPDTPKKQTADRPLRVVFFGVYTPLQGTPTIGAALSLLKKPVEVTMIGGGQDLAAAKQAASSKKHITSVTWTDWVEAAELPSIVAEHDVCLGIFGTGSKARHVVPNKVYQGAAAGCAIVTADTAPQRHVLGDAAVFVAAGDAQALATVLDDLAANHQRVRQLRQAAYQRARPDFTPRQVVTPLVQKMRFSRDLSDKH
ncbi:MAG: glycosyltransferase [Candidatus Saccharimonadales bacterium]